MIASIALVAFLVSPAAAQPQPTESAPAETPEALAAQIKTVTAYLVEVQRWKKHAAAGQVTEARRKRIKEAEALYRHQHDLLLELTSRLQLWAYIADRLDREHPVLSHADVGKMRQREVEAIRELRDDVRASPAPITK